MKKKALRLLSTVLTAALLVTAVPAIPASAALSEVNSPAGVSSFQSSDNFDAELLRAWVVNDGEDLKIDYKTPLMTSQFNLSLYRVGEQGQPVSQYSVGAGAEHLFRQYDTIRVSLLSEHRTLQHSERLLQPLHPQIRKS